jgi:hypothetical protein
VQTYSQPLIKYVNDHEDSLDIQERMSELAMAYLTSFWVVSRISSSKFDQADTLKLHDAQKKCIEGVLILRLELVDTIAIDKALLASPFHLDPDSDHLPAEEVYLTPLYTYPRHLISVLQTHTRTTHTHTKPGNRATTPSTVVTEREAVHAISILDIFVGGIEEIGLIRLPGVRTKKSQAQTEKDVARPLRLIMEATLIKCDLALSMGTVEIQQLKRRAKLSVESEDDDLGWHGEEVEKAGNEDPVIEWETVAETTLIKCLEMARGLVDENRSAVLSEQVHRTDWLPQDSTIPRDLHNPPPPDPDSGKDDESSASLSDEEDEEQEAYPCPLRTLFRLHDRYEEQRLAVWLSLPNRGRVGMGTYLRGIDGKVGDAWDVTGLSLMVDYDRSVI